MPNITFRPLNDEADARIIAEWFYDQWCKVPPYYSVEQEHNNLRKFFQASENRFPLALIAYDGKEPVAILCAGKKEKNMGNFGDDAPWIYSMFVREDVRSGGIGSKLLNELHRVLAKQGFCGAFVGTREASRFYSSNGYESVTTLEKGGQKVVLLRKKLPRFSCHSEIQIKNSNPKARNGLPKP